MDWWGRCGGPKGGGYLPIEGLGDLREWGASELFSPQWIQSRVFAGQEHE